MGHSLYRSLVTFVTWFVLFGPGPVAVAAEASLSVRDGNSISLCEGDRASTFRLKRQGARQLTLKLVAITGDQVQTCATHTNSWKINPKEEPKDAGEILLLYKHQTDEKIIPLLGFDSPNEVGAGASDDRAVKLKGTFRGYVRAAYGTALSPKREHLLEIAVIVEKDGGKKFGDSFGDSPKDFSVFTPDTKTLMTLEEVKTWAKKHPKASVIILTLSWLPAK